MLPQLLFKSIQRRRARMVLAVVAVAMGASIASALLSISFDINEKMGKELRSYGANIVLLPKTIGIEREAYISEPELYKMKTIFWRHNIVGYAPFLQDSVEINDKKVALTGTYFEEEVVVPGFEKVFVGGRKGEGETAVFKTGVKKIAPWWRIQGRLPNKGDALVGISAAEKLGLAQGEPFKVKYNGKEFSFVASGILSTGGSEDSEVFISLKEAQLIFGKPNAADKVVVSALTKPEPEEKIDLSKLSPDEFEKWYCTPYISSIMLQLEEVIPSASAKPIRQVAENEGRLLRKFDKVMLLITAVGLATASLGVMAAMTTAIFERRYEVGLMKAIGADEAQIFQLFFSEAAVIGIIGGILGITIGAALARILGTQVFGAVITFSPTAVSIALSLSVAVALLGSLLPVREAARLEPIATLRGG